VQTKLTDIQEQPRLGALPPAIGIDYVQLLEKVRAPVAARLTMWARVTVFLRRCWSQLLKWSRHIRG
jgi:hypothetical protein